VDRNCLSDVVTASKSVRQDLHATSCGAQCVRKVCVCFLDVLTYPARLVVMSWYSMRISHSLVSMESRIASCVCALPYPHNKAHTVFGTAICDEGTQWVFSESIAVSSPPLRRSFLVLILLPLRISLLCREGSRLLFPRCILVIVFIAPFIHDEWAGRQSGAERERRRRRAGVLEPEP
jgi:hypothetical protein